MSDNMKCFYCKLYDGSCTHPECDRNDSCCFHCDISKSCEFFQNHEKNMTEQYLTGQVKCLYCGKEWTAVCPESVDSMLECPKCHTKNGQFKHGVVMVK